MTTQETQARIKRAQQRIQQELADLSDDIGYEWTIYLSTSWIDVSTFTEGRSIPCVEVAAELRAP